MPDFDLATVIYSRATVMAEIEQYDDALELIDEAASKFKLFGMHRRVLHSRIVGASILFYKGRLAEAREEYVLVLRSKYLDEANRARTMSNIACCDLELGAFEQARLWSSQAAEMFEKTENLISMLLARWALARSELSLGLWEQGASRLRKTAADFAEVGMVTDSALALLHIVEHSITQDDYDEAARLCTAALEKFVSAGMPMAAARAMAHLRDLAGRGEARVTDGDYVRGVIGDRPRQIGHISM